jgi:hypothetical protein
MLSGRVVANEKPTGCRMTWANEGQDSQSERITSCCYCVYSELYITTHTKTEVVEDAGTLHVEQPSS